MDDNKFGVPAGWYPDPLGLPQLRWWDAQAWTEHTSEARAPIVIQPAATTTRLGYADDDLPLRAQEDFRFADDELPSRREQRERERRENGDLLEVAADTDLDELSAQPLLAMTLRELEPPLAETEDQAASGPRSASSHANAVPAASTLSAFAEELAPARATKQARTYTGAVWLMVIMPILQLVAAVLLITVGGLGHNLPILLVVWIGPYFVILGLAAYDRLVLQTRGHERPASAWWALLGGPAYLIARALHTYKQTGKGFAPLPLWSSAIIGVLVAVIAFPGLVISVLPDYFTGEIEQSVQADARALGADLTVDCPPAPPILVNERFTCIATKPSGATDSISVSLQRANGWIAWRVEDWGLWVLTAD